MLFLCHTGVTLVCRMLQKNCKTFLPAKTLKSGHPANIDSSLLSTSAICRGIRGRWMEGSLAWPDVRGKGTFVTIASIP